MGQISNDNVTKCVFALHARAPRVGEALPRLLRGQGGRPAQKEWEGRLLTGSPWSALRAISFAEQLERTLCVMAPSRISDLVNSAVSVCAFVSSRYTSTCSAAPDPVLAWDQAQPAARSAGGDSTTWPRPPMWLSTPTAAGLTWRVRPVTNSSPDSDQLEAAVPECSLGHDSHVLR